MLFKNHYMMLHDYIFINCDKCAIVLWEVDCIQHDRIVWNLPKPKITEHSNNCLLVYDCNTEDASGVHSDILAMHIFALVCKYFRF